jgi:hypothetical protein
MAEEPFKGLIYFANYVIYPKFVLGKIWASANSVPKSGRECEIYSSQFNLSLLPTRSRGGSTQDSFELSITSAHFQFVGGPALRISQAVLLQRATNLFAASDSASKFGGQRFRPEKTV